jgi:hypothetical protein
MRVLRKRRRTKTTNRPTPALALVSRTGMSVGSGIHVGYSRDVSERRVDREAWADLVRKLVTGKARGNKSAFARTVGVTARTLDRWLAGEVNVSEASVRAVARAFDLDAMNLLVAVGYYEPDQVTKRTPADADDEAMQLILTDPRLSDRQKKRMIQRLDELRARDRAREAEEVRWWIEQASEVEEATQP